MKTWQGHTFCGRTGYLNLPYSQRRLQGTGRSPGGGLTREREELVKWRACDRRGTWKASRLWGVPPVTLSGPKTACTVPRVSLRKQCGAPGPFFSSLRKFAHLVELSAFPVGQSLQVLPSLQSSDGCLHGDSGGDGVAPGTRAPEPQRLTSSFWFCHRRSKCTWCAG